MTLSRESLPEAGGIQAGPASSEQLDDQVADAKRKLRILAEWANQYETDHTGEIAGNSSFLDVVRNLIGAAGPWLRFCDEDVDDPAARSEDLAVALREIHGLEEYEQLCVSHPSILQAESATHEGASIVLRIQADKEAASGLAPGDAILRYIDLLADQVSAGDGIGQLS